MKVRIKRLTEKAEIPFKAHSTDACYDVIATSIEDLGDGRIIYGTGISLGLPKNTQLDVRSRSSIHKTGLILSNGVGTGDEGYIGEYKVVFYNILSHLPNYQIGDKIAQIQLKGRLDMDFEEVDELEETARGEGGFGSSGLKK